jgi:hypothetical protein
MIKPLKTEASTDYLSNDKTFGNDLLESAIKVAVDAYMVVFKKKLLESLSKLGFLFENEFEFEDFCSNRVGRVEYEDKLKVDYFLDYEPQKPDCILLMTTEEKSVQIKQLESSNGIIYNVLIG